MLELKNITKRYFDKNSEIIALKNINLTFSKNGFTVITGKSGSGKSTLLNIIGGLDQFDHGDTLINGESTKHFNANDWDQYRNTHVGFVFQEFYLIESFTIEENIALVLELQGFSKDEIKSRVIEILKQVELENYRNRKPNELSGGQKQRIAIARALVKNPQIILCDEPTGNLDSETGKNILKILKKLSKTKLVLMVTHDMGYANEYGDRIIELKDGEIIDDQIKKVNDNNENTDDINDKQLLQNHKLSYKSTFKMAINSLLNKKLRLIFITLFFILSLSLVGIASAFTFYDSNQGTIVTFKENHTKHIPIIKTNYECFKNKEICTYRDVSVSDNEVNDLNEKYDNISFYPVVHVNLNLLDSPNIKIDKIGLIDHINLDLAYGNYPENNNEIVVSDYIANLLADNLGLKNTEELVNTNIQYNDTQIVISGIIRTDYTNYIHNNGTDTVLEDGNTAVFNQIFMYKDTYLNYFKNKSKITSLVNVDVTYTSNINNDNLIGRLPENPDEIAITVNYYNKKEENLSDLIGTTKKYSYNVIIEHGINDDYEIIDDKDYKIVGIINDSSEDSYDFVFQDEEYLKQLSDNGNDFISTIAVLGNDKGEKIDLIRYLDNHNYRHLTAYSKMIENQNEFFNRLEKISYIIGLVFSVFVSILTFTYISLSIKYKEKDIGILRALGARGKDIGRIFMIEGLMLFIFVSIAATILSNFTIIKINQYASQEFNLNIVVLYFSKCSIAFVFILATVVVLISTYLPIKRVQKMRPINVIKDL